MVTFLKRVGWAVLLLLGGLLTLAAIGFSIDWNPYTGLAGAIGAAGLVVVARRRWAAHTFERRYSTTLLVVVCVVSGILFFAKFDGVFDSQSRTARTLRAIEKTNAEVDRKRAEAHAQKEREEAEARAQEERKEAAARAEREAEEKRKREAAEMVELRKKDPDEYLKRLRATSDLVKWLDEMKVLRPKQYAAYQEEQKRQSEAAELERQRKSPKDYLTLEFNWTKGGLPHRVSLLE
jgi:Sec-independent protein translocase protein TatA